MSKFRNVSLPTPEAFVSAAKTATPDTAALETIPVEPGRFEAYLAYLPPDKGGAPEARVGEIPPPEISPRVMRQVNIEIPETLHWQLMRVVGTMPRMSARRFIMEAIATKLNETTGKVVPW